MYMDDELNACIHINIPTTLQDIEVLWEVEVTLSEPIIVAATSSLSITGTSVGESFMSGGGEVQLIKVLGALTLANITLRDGLADVPDQFIDDVTITLGAAVLGLAASSVSISGCQFIDHQADQGAAVYTLGDAEVTTSLFEGNTAMSSGGAFYSLWYPEGRNALPKAILKDNIFKNNSAEQRGGSIVLSGTMSITNCTFSGSRAGTSASVIFDNRDVYGEGAELLETFNVINSTFVNNEALSAGLFLQADTTIIGCTFERNVAENGAVIITNMRELSAGVETVEFSTAVLNSTFRGNVALINFGSAIYAQSTRLVLAGCSFQDNVAEQGGGAVFGEMPFKSAKSLYNITNSVFRNNTAVTGDGGAVGFRFSRVSVTKVSIYSCPYTHAL
jgi:hypothetical protein